MSQPSSFADRIIVALDYATLEEALRTVEALQGTLRYFKVGLELLTAAGAPQVVSALHARGAKLFFDGKFNDIPNTIESAVRETARLGVALCNLHASSGRAAMTAAAKVKGNTQLIAVTVLTALTSNDCQSIFNASSADKVLAFAREAKACGLDGVVCSPQELELLTAEPGLENFLKVTPGVRPEWSAANDQKRVMTPAEAIRKGATHLVIGRPITRPPAAIGSPVEAAKRVLAELENV